MDTDNFRDDFERMGEAGVENLIVSDDCSQVQRAYAMRWLEEKRRAHLAYRSALMLHRTRRDAARTRGIRLAIGAFVLAVFATSLVVLVFHPSSPH